MGRIAFIHAVVGRRAVSSAMRRRRPAPDLSQRLAKCLEIVGRIRELSPETQVSGSVEATALRARTP